MKKSNLKSVKLTNCEAVQSRILGTSQERVLQLIPSLYRDGLLEPLKGYEDNEIVHITQGNHRLKALTLLNDGITINGYTYKRSITTVLVDIIDAPNTSIISEYQSNNGKVWDSIDTVSAVFDLQAGRQPLLMPISDTYNVKNICKIDKKTGNVTVELLPYEGEANVSIDGAQLKPQQFKRLKSEDGNGLIQIASATLVAAMEKGKKEVVVTSYIESSKKKPSVGDCLTALGVNTTAANFTQVSKPYLVLTCGNAFCITEIMASDAVNPTELPALSCEPLDKITAKTEFKAVELGVLKTLILAYENNTFSKAMFFKLLKKHGLDGLRQYILADDEGRDALLKDGEEESKSAKIKTAFKRLYRMAELVEDSELLDEMAEFAKLANLPTK